MGHTGSPLLDDRLEQRHHDMISRAMRARLGDPELAQDATQDLLERITRDFGRFDPALGTFEHWIMGWPAETVGEALGMTATNLTPGAPPPTGRGGRPVA